MNDIKEQLITVAAEALAAKGHTHLSAKDQVENILAYAASDADFAAVVKSTDSRVIAELKAQIKYICSLGIDTAKGRKLVYVRTRNLNVGNRDRKVWLKMPDISESYHALIHVLVREKAMKNVVVLHTFENYPVEYTGNINDVPVVKSWTVRPSERGQYTGCFVVLYLPDGTPQTSYHHAEDINRTHKAFSKSAKTWAEHTEAMTAKSAILEAARYIPTFDKTISEIIEHHDNDFDWDAEPFENAKPRITTDQATVINDKLNDYSIDKQGFKRWLSSLKISAIEEIPADSYEMILAKIEEKAPQQAAA